jgi:hypothetical protein
VDVGIGHRLHVDKDLLSQNQSEESPDLTTVTYNDKGDDWGDVGLISAISSLSLTMEFLHHISQPQFLLQVVTSI